MKFCIYIVLLLLLQSYLFAGDEDRIPTESNVLDMPQGVLYNSLTGDGYSNQFNATICNLVGANPASLYEISDISFGIAYQFSSKISPAWDNEFGRTIDQYKLNLPQSIGMTLSLGNLNLGFGSTQRYNSSSSIGPFETEYFTPDNPAGTDTSIFLEKNTLVNAYSLISSYSFRDIFLGSDILSAGASLSYNSIRHIEQFWSTRENFNFSGYLWSLGLIYNYYNYNLGIYFEKGDKFKKEFSGNNYIVAKFEDKVHIGLQIQDIYRFKFFGNVTRVFWNDEYINDHFEYSAGLVFKPLNSVSTSLGFFTNDLKYKEVESNLVNYDRSYDVVFLTGGVKISIDQLQFDVVVADSHLFSSKFREQTLIKIAAGYSLKLH